MKVLEKLSLKENEDAALQELKKRLYESFPDAEIILYGSKARGNYEEFSDIDLLILINNEVTSDLEKEITGLAYDIELEYDVVFGRMIENRQFWDSPLAKAMPLHWNIDKEGVKI